MEPGAPQRVRLRRTRGWRLPPGTVVVARPSRWGNPYRVDDHRPAARAVALHERALRLGALAVDEDDVRRELAGRSLACWCGPGPCHADVLLRVANHR